MRCAGLTNPGPRVRKYRRQKGWGLCCNSADCLAFLNTGLYEDLLLRDPGPQLLARRRTQSFNDVNVPKGQPHPYSVAQNVAPRLRGFILFTLECWNLESGRRGCWPTQPAAPCAGGVSRKEACVAQPGAQCCPEGAKHAASSPLRLQPAPFSSAPSLPLQQRRQENSVIGRRAGRGPCWAGRECDHCPLQVCGGCFPGQL